MCGTANGSSGVEASCAFAAFVDLNRHADRLETAARRWALPRTCRVRLFVNVAGKMLMVDEAYECTVSRTAPLWSTLQVEKTMGRAYDGGSSNRRNLGEVKHGVQRRRVRVGSRPCGLSLPASLPLCVWLSSH